VKKILEAGEECSIVKTFFVMEGVQNSGIALNTASVKSAHAMSTWLFHILIN
jgi:hypothetical protein